MISLSHSLQLLQSFRCGNVLRLESATAVHFRSEFVIHPNRSIHHLRSHVSPFCRACSERLAMRVPYLELNTQNGNDVGWIVVFHFLNDLAHFSKIRPENDDLKRPKYIRKMPTTTFFFLENWRRPLRAARSCNLVLKTVDRHRTSECIVIYIITCRFNLNQSVEDVPQYISAPQVPINQRD